jgi:hypothetical protein
MTVTLKDMAMILGLPIRGCPVTGSVDSAGWRERVIVYIGRELPVRVSGVKDREARVCLSWLCEKFHECPLDADNTIMTMYARA